MSVNFSITIFNSRHFENNKLINFFICLERRRRQRIEESIMRRREFQERTNNPARNRNSRQSVDTGEFNLQVI